VAAEEEEEEDVLQCDVTLGVSSINCEGHGAVSRGGVMSAAHLPLPLLPVQRLEFNNIGDSLINNKTRCAV